VIGERAPGLEVHLQRAHDAHPVARPIRAADGGSMRPSSRWSARSRAGGHRLEAASQAVVARRPRKRPRASARSRSRSADEDRQPPARANTRDGRHGIARVVGGGVLRIGIDDVDAVMRDAACSAGGTLSVPMSKPR